jgi:hypothetical protein
VPKQPRPRLLPRHVSENLPKPVAGAKTTVVDYEQWRQMIFDCMNAMIEKPVLTVQVCCWSTLLFFCFLYFLFQDIFELHSYVTMGQQDVMPGRIREECVVVGETGMQNCNFTVFLPSNEVQAALEFLVEVAVFQLCVVRLLTFSSDV